MSPAANYAMFIGSFTIPTRQRVRVQISWNPVYAQDRLLLSFASAKQRSLLSLKIELAKSLSILIEMRFLFKWQLNS